MDDESTRPPFFPIAVDVEAGKTYRWCSCGKSQTQPFCDRDDCKEQCVEYRSILTETLYFCACKLTRDPPLCDGSHAKKLMEYMKSRTKEDS